MLMVISSKSEKFIKWVAAISATILLINILMRFEIVTNPFLNMTFRYSDKKIKHMFENEKEKVEIHYFDHNNRKIRYMLLTTTPDLPYIVFIHGAPGSSGDYLDFFKNRNLTNRFNLISIDRLGYGYSDFGQAETSMQKQGEAIMAVTAQVCKNNRVMLVGHSYGGPIVLKMAALFPEAVASILLLAPAIDPDNELEFKSAQLGLSAWSKWIVPPAWRVAAAEKLTHVAELKVLETELSKIDIPICHMHGTRDSLVPYENTSFSENHFRDDLLEIVKLEKTNHFLPWTHHDLIVEKIINMHGDN